MSQLTKKIEEAKVVVTKQYGKIGPEKVTEETIEVQGFVVEPAKIQVEYGLTLSLGNYEMVRLGVSVTLPCYREEIDTAYDYARKWATDRIEKEVAAVRSNK